MKLKYELVRVQDVYSLRHKILRPNQPLSDCYFLEDKQETAFHMAAIKDEAQIIGISSYYHETLSIFPKAKSIRLRGMAVDTSFQRSGVGQQLLTAAIEVCKNRGADLLWCNARTGAMSFYSKLGFEVIGESFEIANIGEHYLMYFELQPNY